MLNTGKSPKTGFDLGVAIEFIRQKLPQIDQFNDKQLAYILKYIYFYINVSQGGVQNGDSPESETYYEWGLAEGITKTDIEHIAKIVTFKGVSVTAEQIENIYQAQLQASLEQNIIQKVDYGNFLVQLSGTPFVELTSDELVNSGMTYDQMLSHASFDETTLLTNNIQHTSFSSSPQSVPYYSGTKPDTSTKRSYTLLIIGVIVIVLFVLAALCLVSIKVYSNLKNSSTSHQDSTKQTKQIVPKYYTAEEKNKIQEVIKASATLAELEKSVNNALANNEYFINNEGGRKPAKIALTEKTATEYDNRKIYKSMYTLPNEKEISISKIAVERFVTEYMRYPLQLSGGFMDSIIFGTNVTPDPLSTGLLAGGITNTRIIIYSIYELSDDSADGISYAVTTINHEAWHQHDMVALLNMSVDLSIIKELSHEESIEEAKKSIYGEWDKANEKAEKTYTNASFNNDQFNFAEYPYKGYVTGYSMTNIVEDRAEVFSYLMDPTKMPELLEKAKSDEVLQQKINLIYVDLRSYGINPDTDLFN